MKIGIIGAMQEEVEPVIKQLKNKTGKTVGNTEFYIGKIDGTEVVLVRSGIGKANAASATTSLILNHSPDYVINIGTAGAYDEQLKIGNVVISNEAMYSDVNVTAFGHEFGQIPGLPQAFAANRQLIEVAQKSAKQLAGTDVVTGRIVSADTFNSDLARVVAIKNKMKEIGKRITASEMEAASVAQVCHNFGVPFIAIRGITNIAGERAASSFEETLGDSSKRSADLTILTVKELERTKTNTEPIREVS